MTKITKQREIQRGWHLVDAKGKILGRLATQTAKLLIGKNKPYYTSNLDCGDYVVVTNVSLIDVSGKKLNTKTYTSYSGFPGGLRRIKLAEMKQSNPTQVLYKAVSGMLPKNKLHQKRLGRLFVFTGEEHSYKDKFRPVEQKSKAAKVTKEAKGTKK